LVVSENATNLVAEIDRAMRRISDVFAQQCGHGAQSKSLPAEMAACGQFVGTDAQQIEQHGLHGMAAALRVLGPQTSDECRALVVRLVTYCQACFGLHPTITLTAEQRVRDTDNVIKLGELLYGLSFVTAAHADRDRLIRHIAERLNASIVDGRGWGYFTGDSEAHLLPTAYALRGLAQHNFPITAPRTYILDHLQRTPNSSTADITTAIACAYCLTFSGARATNEEIAISKTFRAAWPSLEPLLEEDIEQNLEYSGHKATHYVRVPWQLYLLALASKYNFWRFASFRAQRRLHSVLGALQNAGFKYPYSGRYMSSRTYGIAFDALDEIRESAKRLVLLRFAYGLDRIRVVAGRRSIRIATGAIAVGLMVYSVYQWHKTGKLADLAPNFLASLLAFILASARREP
jgi:hypothetical protein